MTEWGVIGVIVTLVGLFFTVGKPVVDLNKSLTENTTETRNLKKSMETFQADSKKTHKEQWDHIHANSEKLVDHEARITNLEDHQH